MPVPLLTSTPSRTSGTFRPTQAPKQPACTGAVRATDHNQYIHGGVNIQSNYMAGVRVYDISSIPEDPAGNSVCEIISTSTPRTMPSPAVVSPMYGTWSSYYLRDPATPLSTPAPARRLPGRGWRRREKCPRKTCSADNCLRDASTSVAGRLGGEPGVLRRLTEWLADDRGVRGVAPASACGENVIST